MGIFDGPVRPGRTSLIFALESFPHTPAGED